MCFNHHPPLSPQALLSSVVRDARAADHAGTDDTHRGFGELIADDEHSELSPSEVRPVALSVATQEVHSDD